MQHADDGRTLSVWMAEEAPRFPAPLEGTLEMDVCVVGGGIAGLSTAYEVVRAGFSVVVLEDGSLGGGQTRRTTAHLSSAIDDRFTEIERVHGVEGARVAAQSHAAAIDRIEAIVAEEGIACGFERVDGYLCLAGDCTPVGLERELAAALRAGLVGVERLRGCPGVEALDGPCLRFPRQAQFQPLHYLNGLAAAAERRGARLHGGHVRDIESQKDGRIRVATDSGACVQRVSRSSRRTPRSTSASPFIRSRRPIAPTRWRSRCRVERSRTRSTGTRSIRTTTSGSMQPKVPRRSTC